MFKKKSRSRKRSRAMLSAYSIIMVLIVLLGIVSHVLPKARYALAPYEEEATVEVESTDSEEEAPAEVLEPQLVEGEAVEPVVGDEVSTEGEEEAISISEDESDEVETIYAESVDAEGETFETLEACEEVYGEESCAIVDGSGVVGAELYQVLMAPILGFADAIDVSIFIMMLGGLLAVVARTKALETGIKLLVQKLRGKEYILIVLLMFIFSVLGTTYGFLEESVGFYVLIAATMFAAGLDPLVGVATILLGAGSGVLGSTINPFATGVAL